jgi:hypothetical protein
MLISIYIMFWIVSFALAFLSFYQRKKEYIFIPWIASFLFFILGIVSYAIEIPFCEYSSSWTCYTYVKQESGLGWLAHMFGILLLIYAIVESLTVTGKTIEAGV